MIQQLTVKGAKRARDDRQVMPSGDVFPDGVHDSVVNNRWVPTFDCMDTFFDKFNDRTKW